MVMGHAKLFILYTNLCYFSLVSLFAVSPLAALCFSLGVDHFLFHLPSFFSLLNIYLKKKVIWGHFYCRKMVELKVIETHKEHSLRSLPAPLDFDLSNCSDACIFGVDFSAKGRGPSLKFSVPARNWSSSASISAFDPVLKKGLGHDYQALLCFTALSLPIPAM